MIFILRSCFVTCMNNVMTVTRSKDTYIQVRIDDELKEAVRITAHSRGLSMSALIHSILVQAVREEKQLYPEAFKSMSVPILKEPAK